MKDKTDGKLTVRIASSIPKTLHSRDSAERLVRTVVSLWRASSEGQDNYPATLVLDFDGIPQLSESAASAIVEFRLEFSGGKYPAIEFANTSVPVRKTLAAVEKSLWRVRRRVNARKKKTSYMIEI
jgi:hypothetical protein